MDVGRRDLAPAVEEVVFNALNTRRRVRASFIAAVLVALVFSWSRFVSQLRSFAGCDPDPVMDTWQDWASVQVARTVRFIFYRATVHQSWVQFVLQCRRTTYELRDPTPAIGVLCGLIAVMLIARLGKPKQKARRFIDPLAISPEGLVPGSPLLEGGRLPKGQVAVAMKIDGNLKVVGGGIRMENYLITPTHNTHHGYELFVLGGEHFELEAKVDVATGMVLSADVSAFFVPETTWCRIGVSQAKLGPLRNRATVTVTSSCDRKYSVATLRAIQPMGRAAYEGSTLPGFSGSAYMNGQVAVGMHCHGGSGALNGGGYEILYIWQRLKIAIGQLTEDSDRFMTEQLTGSDFQYEELQDQEIVVRFGDGGYGRTRKQIIDRMKKIEASTDWADEAEYEELEDQLTAYVPESALAMQAGFSGEGQRPALKQAKPAKSAESSSLPGSPSQTASKRQRRGRRAASVQPKENSLDKPQPKSMQQLQQEMRQLQREINRLAK